MSGAFDVVVIGAGVAGLAAATRLAEAGARTLVLEAVKRPGGRARSWIDPATGDVVDNGQHLLMDCYQETLAFLERIGTRGLVAFQEHLRVDFVTAHGDRSTIDCPPLPGSASLLAGLLLYRGLSIGDKMSAFALVADVKSRRDDGEASARRVPTGSDPRRLAGKGGENDRAEGAEEGRGVGDAVSRHDKAGVASGPPDESAAHYLERLGQSKEARRNLWDPLILATLNDTPEIASARTFRRVVELGLLGEGGAARLGWSTVGLGELYGPPSQSYLEAHGGVLRTSAPVQSVSVQGDGLEVSLRSGETVPAPRLVCAVTPSALRRLFEGSALSSANLSGLNQFQVSPIVSVSLWFDRPALDAEFVGMIGTTFHWLFDRSRLLRADSGDGRARSTGSGAFESGGRGRTPAFHLTLVESGARRSAQREPAELIGIALADLRAVAPKLRHVQPLHTLVVKEVEATISPSVGWDANRPGAETSDPRIVLAGDWTATGLPATIESAALSGHRAAACLLGAR